MNYRNNSQMSRPILTIIPHGAITERELAGQILHNPAFESRDIVQILCDGPLRTCDRPSRLSRGSHALTICARCIAEQGSGFPTLLLSNFLTPSDIHDVGSYLLALTEAIHTNSSAPLPPFDGIDPAPFLRSPLAGRFPDLLQEASADEGLRAFLVARGITLDTDAAAHSSIHPDRLPRLEASLLCLRALRSVLSSWEPVAMLIFGSTGLITTAVLEAATLENVPSAVISLTPEGNIAVQSQNSRRHKNGPLPERESHITTGKGVVRTFSTDPFFDKDICAVRLAEVFFAEEDISGFRNATTSASF